MVYDNYVPIHYARCLEASFQMIFGCQKGVPRAQYINLGVILVLVLVITIQFTFYFVYYLPAVGDAISIGNDWVIDNRLCRMGPVKCIFIYEILTKRY